MLATSHLGYSNYNYVKWKVQFLRCVSPVQVLDSHKWLVGTLLDTVDFRTFPSSPKVLWLSIALKSRIISFHFSKLSSNFLFYSMSKPLLGLYLIIFVPSSPLLWPHLLSLLTHWVLLTVPSKCQGFSCLTQALCTSCSLSLNIHLQTSAWIFLCSLGSAQTSPSQSSLSQIACWSPFLSLWHWSPANFWKLLVSLWFTNKIIDMTLLTSGIVAVLFLGPRTMSDIQ